MSVAFEAQTLTTTLTSWWHKYKIGAIPEQVRVAKPNTKDLWDIAKPSLWGIPILLVLYVVGDVTAFAAGLAAVVALALLDASRPLRSGYWLGKPAPAHSKQRFLIEEGIDPEKWWGKRVQAALNAHGIQAAVVALDTSGASMDVYELDVQKGFDISAINALGDNFSRTLALAKGERVWVDANIGSGRAALYIPKAKGRVISSVDLLPKITNAAYTLPALVGEDLVGNSIVVDIAQAPHLLIGGELGEERSQQVLNIILSCAYHVSPQQLTLTLIDPKRVELQSVSQLPHCQEPIITDMYKVSSYFQRLYALIEQRCQQFAAANVGHIQAYNALHADAPLAYHVVVISDLHVMFQAGSHLANDEEFTLGQSLKKQLLELLCSMPAPSAGIHFVCGLQSFEPKLIGEQLRTALPSVIGLRMRNASFSQWLIHQSGCETLSKAGECYVFMAQHTHPLRGQIATASALEHSQLVQSIKAKWQP